MTVAPKDPPNTEESLISVVSEGGSALAEETITRAGPFVAQGLARGVPFLGRRRIVVKAGAPDTRKSTAVGTDLEPPVFVAQLAVEPGGARALLCVDGPAIAFLLEGSLGGDGSDLPKLQKKGLSAPQHAFVDRVVGHMVRTVSSALAKSVGLTLTKLPALSGEKSASGVLVAMPLLFRDAPSTAKPEEKGLDLDSFDEPSSDGEDDGADESKTKVHGTVQLAISKSALTAARARGSKSREVAVDPRVAATLREAQVWVVAELGRLHLSLAELVALRVGDTLRLDVPVNGDVDVRVENRVLLRAQPTAVGTQLAIQITGRHETESPVASGSQPGSQERGLRPEA
jgi:flagellar motor switch protein FliM